MTVKPMLAHRDTPDFDKISYPVIVQPKLDGIRAMVVNGRLVSRTLKPIPNAEIRAALERPEFEGLDGELIVGDPTDPKCYNRSVSFVMAESKTAEPWTYYVFDKWDAPGGYYERVRTGPVAALLPFQWVATVEAANAAELERMEALLVDQGYEGAIARIPDAPYKFGRSGKYGPLLKIKRFADFEAEVVGVFEEQHNGNVAQTNALGRTERSSHAAGKSGKGTLGGLILRALNGDFEGVEFRCGTGFDANQRQALWDCQAALPGSVAKIKYFPVGSKDKPRHPVFLGWRDMEIDG